uniref:Uncharacterized protein n=1 Tax=Rhizophora mucronata TaxID=61149 RepID=A0A2P2QZE3_RHIMU
MSYKLLISFKFRKGIQLVKDKDVSHIEIPMTTLVERCLLML